MAVSGGSVAAVASTNGVASMPRVDHGPHYTSLLLGNPYFGIIFSSLVPTVVRELDITDSTAIDTLLLIAPRYIAEDKIAYVKLSPGR
jgi:hypothetical protein